MGTSSGYKAPTKGDWTSLKKEIGKLLDNKENRDIVISKFITAIGGAKGFSSSNKPTKSSAGGKSFRSTSARKTSQNVLSFFSDINKSGIEKAFTDRGLDIDNKSLEEVKDILIDYFSEASTDADSDASSRAIATVLDELFSEIESEKELESFFSEVISDEKIKYVLCGFYEKYIFELFARVFYEDRTEYSNQHDANEILEIAEETIKAKIETYNCSYSIKDIDFKEQSGADFVQAILNEVLELLEDL